jgi:hypothetical protein
MAKSDTHTTIKELLEAVFSVWSVPRLYNEVGVKWPAACEDMSPEAEEHPLLEDITKQSTEGHDWEHWSLCDSDFEKCSHELCVKVSSKSNYQSIPRLQPLNHMTIYTVMC